MTRNNALVVHPVFLIGAAVLSATVGCGSDPVEAPKSFADFNSPVGTFACKYPEGWKAEGGGKRGLEWAKIESGPAHIQIDAGVAGSLVGDIAGIGKDPNNTPPELEPVHTVHVAGEKAAEKQFSGYKEIGNPEPFEAALGPARRSEFTASTTFGSGLHGYRATVLAHDKSVTVSCICPESDWKTLQPAFDTVLTSLHRGHPE